MSPNGSVHDPPHRFGHQMFHLTFGLFGSFPILKSVIFLEKSCVFLKIVNQNNFFWFLKTLKYKIGGAWSGLRPSRDALELMFVKAWTRGFRVLDNSEKIFKYATRRWFQRNRLKFRDFNEIRIVTWLQWLLKKLVLKRFLKDFECTFCEKQIQ